MQRLRKPTLYSLPYGFNSTNFTIYVGNADYIPVVMSVTFQQNGEQFCVNISIIDDPILEITEFFTVRPTSNDTDVTIANSTATVVEITDNNDSKSWLVYFGML